MTYVMIDPNQLTAIGFTNNEATVYLALLELGESLASTVAKRASMPRTYTYDLLRSLEEKGFVTSLVRKGKRHYGAIAPKRIRQMAATKLRYFDEIVPELEGLYQGAPDRPRVRFFEGKAGIEMIHSEAVSAGTEVKVFGSIRDWIENFPNWYDFMRRIVESGVVVKDLVQRLPETERYSELYKGTTSEMRFTKPEWKFETDSFIWGRNMVALISYVKGNMHGIVIESTPIHRSLLTTFEILWDLAEQR